MEERVSAAVGLDHSTDAANGRAGFVAEEAPDVRYPATLEP
jgi:hypothetical protein